MDYPSRRAKKISLVPFNVTRSWSEEDRKGKLWEKPALSSRYTCSPGQGAYSLFVDMLRQWGKGFKNEVLKIFTIKYHILRVFN